MRDASSLSFFSGVPEAALGPFVESLERRTYPAGAVLVGEGDQTGEIFLVQAGRAEVVVAGPDGDHVRVGHVTAGETVGEMALLTGEPAAATVRAVDDVSALVVTDAQFAEFGERHPEVYRRLGAVLAERLTRTNRLLARVEAGRLTVAEDDGSPPLLGYGLGCALAWHTCDPTLVIALRDEVPEELRGLARASDEEVSTGAEEGRAHLLVAAPEGRFAADRLASTVESLRVRFPNLVVQGRADRLAGLPSPSVALRTEHGTPAADGPLTIRGWTAHARTPRPGGDRIVEVPSLSGADVAALQDGVLPATGGAGDSLGWAARDLAGLKVGVALGAGSLRGWAHVGVLGALKEAGVKVDYIAGTSVGAAVAGLYALGKEPDEIADILSAFSPNLFRLTLPFRSLLSNRAMRRFMQEMAPDARLEDLRTPVAIVAADIVTQREVVFRRGPTWQAVLTSISIPGVYPASPMGEFMLVDGGVINPVPSSVVAEMGADVVLAVRLAGPTLAAERDFECVPARGAPPTVLAVLLRSIEIMQSRIVGEPTDANVVTIAPVLATQGAKLKRFADGRRFIADGAAATEDALPRIAAALPWVRRGG